MNSRIATLKAMDTIMRNAEDEQVTMAWFQYQKTTGYCPDKENK